LNGSKVVLPQDGITMTRKLAETLHVKLGDSILLKPTDKSYVSVPIKQIIYMSSGQAFYMTDSYWEFIGEDFIPTSLLVKWKHMPDESFLNGDYVKDYVDRSSQQVDFASNTKVVSIAVMMMIVMGAILAFVVLYNSSILNFAERTRDLATLRVLGYYRDEIRSLVLMENILSVAFGVVFGVPVGKLIADLVASGFDNQMDLIGRITISIVALAAVTTFIFALIINIIVAKKMEKVDMLQALKSVE
jgi:putative ABC transport system permease protein